MALSLVITVMLATADPRANFSTVNADVTPVAIALAKPETTSTVSPGSRSRPDLDPQSQNFSGPNDISAPESPKTTATGASEHHAGASPAAAAGSNGLGRSNTAPGVMPSHHDVASIESSHTNGVVAGGGVGPSMQSSGGADNATESNNATGSNKATGDGRVAPWDLPTWSNDRDAGLKSADGEGVPDSYRDLVREYFQR
jgi:hypothetical protein